MASESITPKSPPAIPSVVNPVTSFGVSKPTKIFLACLAGAALYGLLLGSITTAALGQGFTHFFTDKIQPIFSSNFLTAATIAGGGALGGWGVKSLWNMRLLKPIREDKSQAKILKILITSTVFTLAASLGYIAYSSEISCAHNGCISNFFKHVVATPDFIYGTLPIAALIAIIYIDRIVQKFLKSPPTLNLNSAKARLAALKQAKLNREKLIFWTKTIVALVIVAGLLYLNRNTVFTKDFAIGFGAPIILPLVGSGLYHEFKRRNSLEEGKTLLMIIGIAAIVALTIGSLVALEIQNDGALLFKKMIDSFVPLLNLNQLYGTMACTLLVISLLAIDKIRNARAHYLKNLASALPKLHQAAIDGDVTLLRKLLDKNKVDVNAFDQHGRTALHYAVMHRQLECIQMLMKRDANPNLERVRVDLPLLHQAALDGDVERLKELISTRKIDVNAEDKYLQTALYYATLKQNRECMKLLIKAGANPILEETSTPEVDKTELPALHRAAFDGDIVTINALIEIGLDITVKDTYGQTALYYAARKKRQHCVEALIEAGANPLIRYEGGTTALHEIIWQGNEELRRLGKRGIWKEAAAALEACATELVEDNGAAQPQLRKINDPQGNNLLDLAIAARNLEIIRFLLKKGATTNNQDSQHYLALMNNWIGDIRPKININSIQERLTGTSLLERGYQLTSADLDHFF